MKPLPTKRRLTIYVSQSLYRRLLSEAIAYRMPLSSWIVGQYLISPQRRHNGKMGQANHR